MNVSALILAASALLLAAVFASKLGSRFGIPGLLLFLAIGMLSGSEGPGHVPFDDPGIAMLVGSAALALILFDGGLQTDTDGFDRGVLRGGAVLATVGVGITAGIVAAAAMLLLGLPLQTALLLGAILSSTDAAAVFSVLRARGVGMPRRLRHLIEFESGSNDPTAVFLTVSFLALQSGSLSSPAWLPLLFVYRLAAGALIGLLAARGLAWVLGRIELDHEGLYPVLTLATVGVTFGLAEVLQTSGFMAAYVCGLGLSSRVFIHRRSIVRFHDGVAWLMQIVMFLMLGLLVQPSNLLGRAAPALVLAVTLVLVARPVAVFVSLIGSGFSWREKLLVSWVGLRGAAPIILATFPMVAGVGASAAVFETVFFAVVVSTAVQAPTVGVVTKLLGLASPAEVEERDPLELAAPPDAEVALTRVDVARGSAADGHRLVDVGPGSGALVAMVRREGRLFIPDGGSRLAHGDQLFVLGPEESVEELKERTEGTGRVGPTAPGA